MIKTTEVVKEILLASDSAQLAASEGILNVSAFSRLIQPQVEAIAKKEVKVGTITTALYRLMDQLTFKNFKPLVELLSLSLQPNVVAITYERSAKILSMVPKLLSKSTSGPESFYTFTQGPEEVTIITSVSLADILIKKIGPGKKVYKNLVALSVRFSEKYLEIPNTLYTLLSRLAVKHINVIEVVSTLTSLTVVVSEKEVNLALDGMRPK